MFGFEDKPLVRLQPKSVKKISKPIFKKKKPKIEETTKEAKKNREETKYNEKIIKKNKLELKELPASQVFRCEFVPMIDVLFIS